MRGLEILLLLLPLLCLAKLVVAETVNPSTGNFSMQQPVNQSVQQSAVLPTSTLAMPEAKRIEPWSLPSPPEFTPIHEPSTMPYSSLPNMQPIMPANYYLPGNQYAPPPTTEFRSEHYAYPFEPNYPYPVAPPPIDTSLIPTAKHFVIVSFIGLLLLFAIIQNSIAAAKRKDALVEVLSNRKKRELITSTDFKALSPELESALREDARVRCIQRTLCYENRKLLEDLGVFGKILARYLTRNVQKSLKYLTPGWDRLVEDAANAGLRGEDCDVVYRDCSFENSNNSQTIDDDEEEEEKE